MSTSTIRAYEIQIIHIPEIIRSGRVQEKLCLRTGIT